MYFFKSDYTEGALPEVMEALLRTNLESTPGYGKDHYCEEAAAKLKARFLCPDADVHFLVGGTQANYTCISAFLRPWEAVISARSGHIADHETGAVEARGHKICTVETPDGKLRPEQIRAVCHEKNGWYDEHMETPKMVYVSNPTELGTLYRKEELQALRDVCDELDLYLYLDGARLPIALTSLQSDLLPEDYPKLCDAFYVGGTKNGLLFGEAVVLVNDALKSHFRHMIKQCGGMLAKGRLLGVQFSTYFDNDLWLVTARKANELAERLGAGIAAKGYRFHADSAVNMLFPVFKKSLIEALEENFAFEYIEDLGNDEMVIRFVTSWATQPEAVDALLNALPDAD